MSAKKSFQFAVLSLMSILALTQIACLRTRMKIRDGEIYDSTPASASAPSSGDVAAAAASSSYVIDEMKAEIARLTGRIEDLERQKNSSTAAPAQEVQSGAIKALEERVIELEKTQLEILERMRGSNGKSFSSRNGSDSSDSRSTDSGDAFEKGRAAHAAGKFEEAIAALESYLSQNPKGKNVEEALFLKGESEFLTKQYKAAIVDFSKISDKFPRSKRIPLALLKIAQSFEALGMADDAKGFYQEIVERFPKSSEAKKAKARLKG